MYIYILYYVTIQYIDIIIIIYILYYRDHIASCWSPFFNNWWPVGVPGYMGIRANSRLLRTLPSKLPCTTVTKPWHVEKQCHEPSIWEWVIPPIKMVKNWGWFIFFTNIHVFFSAKGPYIQFWSRVLPVIPHISNGPILAPGTFRSAKALRSISTALPFPQQHDKRK